VPTLQIRSARQTLRRVGNRYDSGIVIQSIRFQAEPLARACGQRIRPPPSLRKDGAPASEHGRSVVRQSLVYPNRARQVAAFSEYTCSLSIHPSRSRFDAAKSLNHPSWSTNDDDTQHQEPTARTRDRPFPMPRGTFVASGNNTIEAQGLPISKRATARIIKRERLMAPNIRMERLPRWKCALFAALIMGAGLGLAEVVARAVDAWTYVSVEELNRVYSQRRSWRLGDSWPLQRGDYPYLPYVPNPDHPDVNELGFRGEAFAATKAPHTYRVFCLGGSTTWNGYPAYLEQALSDDFAAEGLKLEVINAGNQCWTTLESLINFITRCLPLEPDAIVVYHAINDVVFSFAEDFSPDYTHLRKRFEKDDPLMWDYLPSFLDRSAAFVGFRALFERKVGTPGIGITITKDIQHYNARPFQGLDPFRQNLRTLVSICQDRGIDVFLCTQVFNRDYDYRFDLQKQWPDAVDEANEITRSFADRLDRVHVIDVDAMLIGNNTFMTDYCHFTEDGKSRLAGVIARHIRPRVPKLAQRRNRPSPRQRELTMTAFLRNR